jgi:DNA polymerase-3 subunit gamma/tau
MAYQSLYLKYRPQRFADVVGQDHVCRTLSNALGQGKVAHAYLFCGPRGTGKTTTARLLAKALCCTSSPGPTQEPCNECPACVGIREGNLLDVVELDAASNRGIDEVRNLREIIGYQPTWARYKILIIDEVHQMTKEAFNALLKTLEEPPEHAFFILATTDPQKVPVTILSRCQRFDFRRVSMPEVAALLRRISDSEGFLAEEAALAAMARLSDGCVRDAITTLDQVAAYTDGNVSVAAVNEVVGGAGFDLLFELSDILARGAAAEVFPFVERLVAEGKSCVQVMEELVRHLRNVLVARLGAASETGLEADAATVKRYLDQARGFTEQRLAAAVGRVAQALDEMRWNGQHRIVTEIALVDIAGGFSGAAQAIAEPPAARPAKPPARKQSPAKATPSPAPVGATGRSPAAEPEALDLRQPAPEPPAAESSPPDAPEGDLPGAATPEWQRAVIAIVGRRPGLSAALTESTATVVDDELVVTVPKSFHRDVFRGALEDPEQAAEVLRLVVEAYGRPLTVVCEVGEVRPGRRPAATESAGEAQRSPVDLVLSMFDGAAILDG